MRSLNVGVDASVDDAAAYGNHLPVLGVDEGSEPDEEHLEHARSEQSDLVVVPYVGEAGDILGEGHYFAHHRGELLVEIIGADVWVQGTSLKGEEEKNISHKSPSVTGIPNFYKQDELYSI